LYWEAKGRALNEAVTIEGVYSASKLLNIYSPVQITSAEDLIELA